MSCHVSRRGVTHWDVVALVLVLFCFVALFTPSIRSRPGGTRTTCLNNMRNIGMALYRYDEAHGNLPGYRSIMAGDPRRHPDAGATIPVSWVFSILPDLEQSQLAMDLGDDSKVLKFKALGYENARDPRVNMPRLNILTCPSDARDSDKSSHLPFTTRPTTSYVVNCGQPETAQPRDVSNAEILPDVPANGVFHDGIDVLVIEGRPQFDADGKPVPVRVVRSSITAVQAADGTSNTVMVSENQDAGFYPEHEEWNIGFVWVPRKEAGQRWPFVGAADTLRNVNREPGRVEKLLGDPTGVYGYDRRRLAFARPSSGHSGGVNVAFCDGHTKFIAEQIDYIVWCQLMTPDGAHGVDVQRHPGTLLTEDNDPENDEFATRKLDEAEY